jgi:hypothetical protein
MFLRMRHVRIIHWKATEAGPLIDACRSAGFAIDYLEGDGGAVCRAIRVKMPDVVVIDLSRLPGQGREVGVWLRSSKATREIPIVFVGGDPVKIAAIRQVLPDATYCELGHVTAVVTRAAWPSKAGRRAVAIPPGMMERGRTKSAAQKLGIQAGMAVAVIDPPREFPGLLGAVPESVEFRDETAPVTLWFVHDREGLLDSLRRMRTLAGHTKLWLLWRKRASGNSGNGLTQNALRDTIREVGLVDYKICAVDEKWSAMLFARRKE